MRKHEKKRRNTLKSCKLTPKRAVSPPFRALQARLVDLQEGLMHLRPLLVGQRDGHHGEAGAAEGRGLGEGTERVDDLLGDVALRHSLLRRRANSVDPYRP